MKHWEVKVLRYKGESRISIRIPYDPEKNCTLSKVFRRMTCEDK